MDISSNQTDVSNSDVTFIVIQNQNDNKNEPNNIDLKKLNNLNHITLEYFSNIGLYNKIISKNGIEHHISKSDKKFYKKRIINETKKMLKDEFQSDIVIDIFNRYIFSLINHFKMVDTNELLQKEFLDGSNNDLIYPYADISSNLYNKYISMDQTDIEEDNDNNIDISVVSNCNPNELLFKQKDCKILTMDDFITKKSKQKEKVNYPLMKNINLREPDLKMKGIQKKIKKENINNV